MDTEDNSERADRLKFVVAIMTKDYSKAINIGASIINRQPNDLHVHKCLSALRKIKKPDKSVEREKSSTDDEANASTSGTEESDESSSSSDGETCEKVIETAAQVPDRERVCQSRSTITDCIREAVSASTGCTGKKSFTFREKMYRVLPLKFARKKLKEPECFLEMGNK